MASDTPDNFDLMAVLSRTVDSEPLVMPCEEQCSLNTDNTSLEHTKTWILNHWSCRARSIRSFIDVLEKRMKYMMLSKREYADPRPFNHKFGGLTTEKFIEFFLPPEVQKLYQELL
ncbi:unnamed protein product [Rhizophagus irregularis]|nr:unnamed protein product [Rhizophagus irregularis]